MLDEVTTAGEGFEVWYRRLHPRLLSSLTAITGDVGLATEVTDDTLTIACARWDRIGSMALPNAWAHRRAHGTLRRRERRRRVEAGLRRGERPRPCGPPPAAWSADLWSALWALGVEQRTAIVLRHVAGLTATEAATATGRTPEAVAFALDDGERCLIALLSGPMRPAGEDGLFVSDLLRPLASRPPSLAVTVEVVRGRVRRRRRRSRNRLVSLALLAGVACAVLVDGSSSPDRQEAVRTVGAGPAPTLAATRSYGRAGLRVSPNQDLDDGRSVTVRAWALSSAAEDLRMCAGDVVPQTAATRCDPRTDDDLASGPAFTANYRVRRVITVAGAAFDCAREPAGCVIGIGSPGGPAAFALVTFGSGAIALPPPVVSAAPHVDLRHGDRIAMRGQGFGSNEPVEVAICLRQRGPCNEPLGRSVRASPGGQVDIEVRAARRIYTADAAVECAPAACEVRISGARSAAILLVFDPNGPAAPTPVLAIEPPGPHVLNQAVTVTGSGFPPGARVLPWTCPADVERTGEGCISAIVGGVEVGPDGTFSISRFRLIDHPEGDCASAPGACSLAWIPRGRSTPEVRLPLTFVP